ncbi:MAG: hypothetical protein ACLP05_05575 [Candidatus Kryptoniota bacterium]
MSKPTKILAAIVLLLGIGYAIQRLTSTTSTTENLKPFSSLDTAKIKHISIYFKTRIVIDKVQDSVSGKGSRWVINSPALFPADP